MTAPNAPEPDAAVLAERLTFATQIATAAGERLAGLRQSGRWTDEKILGDIGDQAADGYLQGCLLGRYPDDGILSEETKDSPARRDRRYTWIVDPLDGTKEYRTNRHDWAVHVGLCYDGQPVLGAVALPGIGRVISGICAAGHERAEIAVTDPNGDTAREFSNTEPASPLRVAVSRSHTPDWVEGFADHTGGAELVRAGSVGFKVSLLLLGQADVYVHKIGLKEWDTCAPEAIARALGWAVCRLDGSTQMYNQENPRNDEIAVCRPAIKDRVMAGIRASL
ncbi:MAG: 3'(2'),5'-bisphosphate nucleotidase CysQ [bacterium]|nr:3'(2'),5'-bisphosphate nucleotidase CysQ [bacterium]